MKKSSLLFIALIIFTISISTVSATDIIVDSGNNDTIADGLSQANDGETIELIGTFSGQNNVEINIDKNIKFTANITTPATINGENSYQLFYNREGYDVTFENIIFINANSSLAPVIRSDGGTLTFINCKFNDNYGGLGTILQDQGILNVNNCSFVNNIAESGGGAIATLNSEVNIVDCVFDSNFVFGEGGAIISEKSILNINNCEFKGNKAGVGGAINVEESILSINNSEFINNEAEDGGAIHAINSELTLTNSVFDSNIGSEYGGAIFQEFGKLIITNVNFNGDSVSYYRANVNDTDNSLDSADLILFYEEIDFYVWEVEDFFDYADPNDYDETLWNNLVNAFNNAKTIYPNITTQEEIDYLSEDLSSTFLYLLSSILDFTILDDPINKGNDFLTHANPDDYDIFGWERLVVCVAFAEDMRNSQLAWNQDDIEQACDNVYFALSDLIDSVTLNYNSLQNAIDYMNSLNADDYTASSWANLILVSIPAKLMNLERNADYQGQIDALVTTFNNTIKSLVPLPSPQPPSQLNYDGLLLEILSLLNLEGSKYVPASWAKLQAVLAPALAMHNLKNATSQEEINAHAHALNTARKNLVVNTPKKLPDLKITKVKRVGNKYKITIKNIGNAKAGKSKLMIYCPNGKYVKLVNVKALGTGSSVTITVKFFKYSITKKYKKIFNVNYNKAFAEKSYINNIYTIAKAK